jgi:integrase
MASIDKRIRDGRTRWRVRYRDPAGAQRNKTFARRVDAERFLVTVESSKLSGSYLDPALARLTVADWAARWLDGQVHLKPSTRERYAGILRQHVVPRWGTIKLADVTHSAVQGWVSELATCRAPATVRKVHRVFSLVLQSAVKDGRLVRNPASSVNLPRVVVGERRYLSHEQVHALATECEPYRLIVLFLAYTGVRFGELAALRVGKLHLLGRRATISEAVTEVNGGLVWGTPKGHDRRDVPIPRFLVDELAEKVAGKAHDELVFPGTRGSTLRVRVFRRGGFDAAIKRLSLAPMHPHELRHTAASLAIASGADVKVVQQMLGHKSATMTLDLYSHLFGDRLDEVADALDVAARAAGVSPVCPRGAVVDLDVKRRSATGQGIRGL